MKVISSWSIVFGVTIFMIILFSLKTENISINSVNAQNGNIVGTEQQKSAAAASTTTESSNSSISTTTTTANQTSTLTVSKVIECDSELGIPSDEAVCQFVLANVAPSQFTMIVTGNNPNPSKFQGSANGTNVQLNPGKYTVSENPYDTIDIENLLGESTTGSVSTTASGDCIGQFSYLDAFQNATGTMAGGDKQKCEIINTIEITAGATP
jgi:hypothetical protein